MTTDARALIEEATRSLATWTSSCAEHKDPAAWDTAQDWLRTNLATLLTGYSSALDEVGHWREARRVALEGGDILKAEIVALRKTQDRLVARIAATDSPADIADTLAGYDAA